MLLQFIELTLIPSSFYSRVDPHPIDENAISDPGEVSTAASWRIRAIRCRPQTISGGCLTATAGVILTDGMVRPTYDWLPRRVE